jgi:predicted O-methyltransferase YrrM
MTAATPSSTLHSPRVQAVLMRLFAAARASDAEVRTLLAHMPPEERARRMSDPDADYRGFYALAREHFLAVAPATAQLLYMLARARGATQVVEFGTSFGVSTLHLAAAVRDNGGGRVIGSELEPAKAARARQHLCEAGLDDLVDVREGDALTSLASDLPQRVDFLLLDGHKGLYERVLALVAPRLAPGAVLVADNADLCPAYLERVRAPGSGYLSCPFGDDVELSVRL